VSSTALRLAYKPSRCVTAVIVGAILLREHLALDAGTLLGLAGLGLVVVGVLTATGRAASEGV
jgi:hypothetical protein